VRHPSPFLLRRRLLLILLTLPTIVTARMIGHSPFFASPHTLFFSLSRLRVLFKGRNVFLQFSCFFGSWVSHRVSSYPCSLWLVLRCPSASISTSLFFLNFAGVRMGAPLFSLDRKAVRVSSKFYKRWRSLGSPGAFFPPPDSPGKPYSMGRTLSFTPPSPLMTKGPRFLLGQHLI